MPGTHLIDLRSMNTIIMHFFDEFDIDSIQDTLTLNANTLQIPSHFMQKRFFCNKVFSVSLCTSLRPYNLYSFNNINVGIQFNGKKYC